MSVQDSYYPTGYNDKYREKAMMRKAYKNITQSKSYMESNDIVALAKRVAFVEPQGKTNNFKDLNDLKKLAGL
jgi:hypothetical protein